jgi:hypothetical protein
MQSVYLAVLAPTCLLGVAASALAGPALRRRRWRRLDHRRYPQAAATRLGIVRFGPQPARPWPPEEFATPWYMHWVPWW